MQVLWKKFMAYSTFSNLIRLLICDQLFYGNYFANG
jgi:hypothetical protein